MRPSRSRIVARISPTFSGQQHPVIKQPAEDGGTGLADAGRAQGVGFARPAERRLRPLVRLQQGQLRPCGRERTPRPDPIGCAEHCPRHPGAALSIVDLVTALYFEVMRVDPARPDWPDRDRFVLSKGHGCMALYAALALGS